MVTFSCERSILIRFGHRTCPGRFIGLDFVWIVVASLLSTYNISKAVDENGQIIEVKPDYTSILIRYVQIPPLKAIRSTEVPVFSAIPNHLNAVLLPDQTTPEHLLNRPKIFRFETWPAHTHDTLCSHRVSRELYPRFTIY